MDHSQYAPLLFLLFFALMWLAITTLLGFSSGWYKLQNKYPDQIEDPLLKLNYQLGMMKHYWVASLGRKKGKYLVTATGSHGIRLEICPSGLRVGIMKLLGGIFCRDFFVPWKEISVDRRDRFFQKEAQLKFGDPYAGELCIESYVADRLARAAQGKWPEAGPFPIESRKEALSYVLRQWSLAVAIASLFFIVVPRIASPSGASYPPIPVAILFPAIICGIFGIFIYFRRIKK